ncbi:TraB family protein [compost metagenome]
MKATPEYYQTTIKDRNIGMIEKIEGYLEDKSKETYFVVVGALHMVGKDGIVTRLKEKGYTVTRL